jgi:predicted signal transduction protein with EAL and GGDEF domain
MRLETVAEFVEDQATLNLLGKLGITWAQGYLLGEPTLLSERLGSLVAKHPGDAESGGVGLVGAPCRSAFRRDTDRGRA